MGERSKKRKGKEEEGGENKKGRREEQFGADILLMMSHSCTGQQLSVMCHKVCLQKAKKMHGGWDTKLAEMRQLVMANFMKNT